MRERLLRLIDLLPPVFLFVVVMGSIYLGWATPTESAALGVIMALVLCGLYGKLSMKMLHECFITTVSVTAMIMLIAAAAFFLNFVLGLMGVPQALASFASKFASSQLLMIVVLTIFYLILGCFLDALAMVIGTIPIVFPIITALGIDPVWFGIYLVVMAELALITPPVGMNLYVVQGIRKEGLITDVIVGTLPFLFMMLLLVVLLWVFPSLALWLPRVSFG
jgi:tripartite ATP-independent transporter DctM subunit